MVTSSPKFPAQCAVFPLRPKGLTALCSQSEVLRDKLQVPKLTVFIRLSILVPNQQTTDRPMVTVVLNLGSLLFLTSSYEK